MPALHKATDRQLLLAGLGSLQDLDHRPVFNVMGCGLFDPEHDWSKTQHDVPGEPPYQYCRDCGRVRLFPWVKE